MLFIAPDTYDPSLLEKYKAFSCHYVSQVLHEQMERYIRLGYKAENLEEDHKPENYVRLYRQLKANSNKPYSERRKIVETAVTQWLSVITPDKTEADIDRLTPKAEELRRKGVNSPEEEKAFSQWSFVHVLNRAFGDGNRLPYDRITKPMLELPEWMQVLIHERGCFCSTASDFEALNDRGGHANTGSFEAAMMSIYINPLYFDRLPKEAAHLEPQFQIERTHILREEFIHCLQKYAEDQARHDSDLNGNFLDSLPYRWQNAAEALIDKIDAFPHHPALMLIQKTEAHGGSLMVPKFKKNHSLRAAELLMDIFDAEIHLRHKQEKTREQTENELKAAFGDDVYVYNASREYVQLWVDQAIKVLGKEIGAEKAEQYRKKWLNDPFTHRITLTELPKYKIGNLDLPSH